MFKAKDNHLNLIQEVRMENALQKAEQQLLRDDIQLVKTLTEQQDSARHEVEQTQAFVLEPFRTLHRLISTFSFFPHAGLATGGDSGGGGERRAGAPV